MQGWGSGGSSLQLGSGGPSSPSPPLWCPTLWMHSLTGQRRKCLHYTTLDSEHGLLSPVSAQSPELWRYLYYRSAPQMFLLYNPIP